MPCPRPGQEDKAVRFQALKELTRSAPLTSNFDRRGFAGSEREPASRKARPPARFFPQAPVLRCKAAAGPGPFPLPAGHLVF